MKLKEKKQRLLKLLYERRYDGSFHDVIELLNPEPISQEEALHIGYSLDMDGFIKLAASKDSVQAKIAPDGIEFIEEELPESTTSSDQFSSNEKEMIIEKLDEFQNRLKKLELGQQIIYDDLTARLDDLKELIDSLNKRNWFSLFKGILIEHGLGEIYEQVEEVLVETFKSNNLLPGK